MAISRRMEQELLRKEYTAKIYDFVKSLGEDAYYVESNQIAFPVVGCNDSEDAIVITIKVPKGANKGTEPYNVYDMAEDYEYRMKEKADKAKAKEKKKNAK